jgi:hypothetical protein
MQTRALQLYRDVSEIEFVDRPGLLIVSRQTVDPGHFR